MFRITVLSVLLAGLLIPGLAFAQTSEDNEANLCFTHYICTTDMEWNIGHFWAHNEPSADTCANYNSVYGSSVGDIWGMCSGYSNTSDDGASSGDDLSPEAYFKLTSQWHNLPDGYLDYDTYSGADPCPGEGLGPIIDYDDNTFICGTGY